MTILTESELQSLSALAELIIQLKADPHKSCYGGPFYCDRDQLRELLESYNGAETVSAEWNVVRLFAKASELAVKDPDFLSALMKLLRR